MKQVKRLISVLLGMIMTLAMAMTVSAATVTLPNATILENHKFTAYQIFAGREDTVNGKEILSDIQWGNGINSETFLAALKADETYGEKFESCTTAAEVADVLTANNTDTAMAEQVAKLAEKCKTGSGTVLESGDNKLADGYYLIVDTTESVGEGGAYNAALLEVVGDINIKVKTDAPTVEKKVKEDDKYNQDEGYGTGYNDVADYNMGEAVSFHLIGTVPDMSRYDTYKYIFHDTLSSGLTAPEPKDVKVYLSADKKVDTDGDNKDTDITDKFKVTVSEQNITVSCDDIKTIEGIAKGNYIIVEYSAVLNENAVIGLDGNPNEVYLQYSNKPDQSGSGNDHSTGKTPKDEVIVFTYELDVTKVDGTNTETKLKGAEFVLLNEDADKVAIVEDGKFVEWQDIPTAGEDGKIAWPEGSILKSDDNGLFSVAGLDDGTYKLREITAPAGYNLLNADVTVVIKATTTNGQNWTDSKAKSALTALTVKVDNGDAVDGDLEKGSVSITIKNNKGADLPETGGIGTTIFYVVGSILVLGAAIVLITKKRMSK